MRGIAIVNIHAEAGGVLTRWVDACGQPETVVDVQLDQGAIDEDVHDNILGAGDGVGVGRKVADDGIVEGDVGD